MSEPAAAKGDPSVFDLVRAFARSPAGTRTLAAAMLPALGLWIWLTFELLRADLALVAAWQVFTALLTIAAAAAVIRDFKPAQVAVLWVLWYDTLWACFWAAREPGFLWGVPLVTFAATLLYGMRREPTQAPAAPAAKEDDFLLWIRENAEAVVVAFIMALIIRCFCIEVFKIPSGSMEPTLLGDVSDQHPRESCQFEDLHRTLDGDRIMVTKYYYALSEIERFDVVVFKFPLNQAKNFIKRVVGLPDEELFMERGNLFHRPVADPAGPFRLARKPLRVQRSLWIRDMNPGTSGTRDDFREYWNQEYADESAELSLHRGRLETLARPGRTDARFRYRNEIRDEGTSGLPVSELSIAFDLELPASDGVFFASLPGEFGTFDLELSAARENRIVWSLGSDRRIEPLRLKHLRAGARHSVEFMVYDGAAVALVDGEVQAELVFARVHSELPPAQTPTPRPSFGARGTLFVLRNLTLGRDLYYKEFKDNPGDPMENRPEAGGPRKPSITPVRIPPDKYMMMGDNVNHSLDSRAWEEIVLEFKDGRKIRFEVLEGRDGSIVPEEEFRRQGLDRRPDYYITADDIGYARYVFADELETPPASGRRSHLFSGKPHRFVGREYIVGKALWTWWPLHRSFRLIR